MDLKALNKEVQGRYSDGPKLNKHLVEIKQSLIPNAGNGLFAKHDIPKDTMIDYYYGKILDRKAWLELDGSDAYVMQLNRNTYIDAKEHKCLVAFTNDARGLTRTPGLRNNCIFELSDDSKNIGMVTTRNIKAGEELFTYYGNSYWKSMEFNIKNSKSVTA